jgi:hypothetical protein
MFQPDYLRRLLDLGYADAGARREEIAVFFAKSPLCPDPAIGSGPVRRRNVVNAPPA